MGLRDRLMKNEPSTGSFSATVPRTPRPATQQQTRSRRAAAPDAHHELKHELHQKLIEKLDLQTIERLPRDQLRDELRTILNQLLAASDLPLNRVEREQMVEELLDEVTGLGPLEPLLADTTISDIMVNGFNTVYVERFGKLELTNVRFRDNAHLQQIIVRIVSRVGRRIDESSPMADARLPDGARVNAIIPPLAHRRPGALDPPLRRLAAADQGHGGDQQRHAGDARFSGGLREGQAQLPHLGRYRHRQDHHAERALLVHPRGRARRHHRGRRRAAAATAARGAAGNAPAQHRRARRGAGRAIWSRTPCVCAPTASSSASAAAARCSTCCRR